MNPLQNLSAGLFPGAFRRRSQARKADSRSRPGYPQASRRHCRRLPIRRIILHRCPPWRGGSPSPCGLPSRPSRSGHDRPGHACDRGNQSVSPQRVCSVRTPPGGPSPRPGDFPAALSGYTLACMFVMDHNILSRHHLDLTLPLRLPPVRLSRPALRSKAPGSKTIRIKEQ